MISRLPRKPASLWVICGLLLALAILCAILAGCSSSGGGSTDHGTTNFGGKTLVYDAQYRIKEPNLVPDVVLTCIHGEGIYVIDLADMGDSSAITVVKDDPLCATETS